MIGFDDFIMVDGTPIYLQILLYIKRGAAAGVIRDGDELPSRRMLSALLGVNPNTVQKAYKQLEDEGLIASHAGTKSLMVLNETVIARLKKELLADEARAMIHSFKQMGLSREETVALIETFWE